MCLAIPMQLVQRTESGGIVELDGIRRAVSLALLPEAELGDHLLVHAGYAIARVDAAEARETLELLRQIAAAADEPPAPPA
ncbi:MAG: HypC/HybG/HupF family hydrogenase formation chaperone [Acidobacteria bacterium]|nr:HypC/HybG/HupF family hydrogenase formation chaperone [Acidobacteriota bacterium]